MFYTKPKDIEYAPRCLICQKTVAIHETTTEQPITYAYCISCGFLRQWPFMHDELIQSPTHIAASLLKANDREFYCVESLNHVSDVTTFMSKVFLGVMHGGKLELNALTVRDPIDFSSTKNFNKEMHTQYTLACLIGLIARSGFNVELVLDNRANTTIVAKKY